MKKFIFFLKVLILISIYQISPSNSAVENKIIANVDDKIISSYELEAKVKLLLFLNNQELNQKNINNAKNLAMNSLINHKLKKKELERVKFSLEDSPKLNSHLKQVSSQYNSDINGLKNIFNSQNLDYDFYLNEIKVEFAWQNFIYKMYKDKINIDENEISKELNKFLENENNIENFKLAEIEMILTNDIENKKKIEEIKNQIKLFGFENTAIKFSDSPSALEGGIIGWISSKALSKKILNLIKDMKPGEITDPIYQSNSIVFFKLIDKKIEKLNNVNLENIKNQIINRKANELINLFSNNYLSKIKNNAFIELK